MSLNKIIFCDTNDRVIEAFKEELKHQCIKNIELEFFNEKFEYIKNYDAIVAAGNSFGVMSGGIDYYIEKYLSHFINEYNKKHGTNMLSIQEKVYLGIKANFLSEVPVGSSFIVETEISNYPYIVYAPTMRTPIELSLNSNNIYNATLSALTTIIKHNQNKEKLQIKTLVIFGMGAGTGGVPPKIVARQMFFAINNALEWQYKNKISDRDFEKEIDKTYQFLNFF